MTSDVFKTEGSPEQAQGGGEVVEYQVRLVPLTSGGLGYDWRKTTKEAYDREAPGSQGSTFRVEYRKLYAAPPSAPVGEFDGTDGEVLREFIRLCREVKPVGRWPGERVCAAIERSMANERPFRFIDEAEMPPERGHNGRGGDEDRTLSGPRRALAQQPVSGRPVLVDSTVHADIANRMYGEAYGIDWVYHDDRTQQPAAAWQAIVEACVITEAVTPDETDPRGTLHRLIDYHVALDRDQQPAAVDGAMVERALRAFHAEGPFAKGTEFERDSMREALTAAFSMPPVPACPHRTRCDCLAACKYGMAGDGALAAQPGGSQ